MPELQLSLYSGNMKSILVTTDFSPHSQYTLKYVLELLGDTKCTVKILLLNTYLVDFNSDPQELVQLNDALKSCSQTKLAEQKAQALESFRNLNITIETKSHMGSLTSVITNLIKKEKIDLVAIGKDNGNHLEQITSRLKNQNCSLLITYHKE